jgi:signal transduction histidine kinase
MKGKTVITQFDASPAQVRVVRDRLQQVFLNLILNALDATEEGGELQIATRSTEGFVQIEMIDSGSGIPPAMQEKLFEAYVTSKETGTGLGLFVCRSLMQEARGRILLLESGPGRTVFRVDVPVA